EEVGLLGTFAVISLFALLAYAGVRIARRAPDKFGRIVAGAVTAWIVGQAVINMGAVTGLLPITGIPLPLVSFGGSSLVFTLTAVGILINIARQEQWPPLREEMVQTRPRPRAPAPQRVRRAAKRGAAIGAIRGALRAAVRETVGLQKRSKGPGRARGGP